MRARACPVRLASHPRCHQTVARAAPGDRRRRRRAARPRSTIRLRHRSRTPASDRALHRRPAARPSRDRSSGSPTADRRVPATGAGRSVRRRHRGHDDAGVRRAVHHRDACRDCASRRDRRRIREPGSSPVRSRFRRARTTWSDRAALRRTDAVRASRGARSRAARASRAARVREGRGIHAMPARARAAREAHAARAARRERKRAARRARSTAARGAAERPPRGSRALPRAGVAADRCRNRAPARVETARVAELRDAREPRSRPDHAAPPCESRHDAQAAPRRAVRQRGCARCAVREWCAHHARARSLSWDVPSRQTAARRNRNRRRSPNGTSEGGTAEGKQSMEPRESRPARADASDASHAGTARRGVRARARVARLGRAGDGARGRVTSVPTNIGNRRRPAFAFVRSCARRLDVIPRRIDGRGPEVRPQICGRDRCARRATFGRAFAQHSSRLRPAAGKRVVERSAPRAGEPADHGRPAPRVARRPGLPGAACASRRGRRTTITGPRPVPSRRTSGCREGSISNSLCGQRPHARPTNRTGARGGRGERI